MESEEDLGFIQPELPHVLTVDDVRSRRTKALSTIEEVRSSIGSHSQASQFSPGAGSVGSIPPVPPIPSMYRQDTSEDPRQYSVAMGRGPSPTGSIRSFHSRAGTDPGPQQQARSSSPVKSISTSSSSLGVRERIAFFDRGASPAPSGLGLVHGARFGISYRDSWTRVRTRAFSHEVTSSSKYDIYSFFSGAIYATYASVCRLHWCSFREPRSSLSHS
jgi:hypothetical protein